MTTLRSDGEDYASAYVEVEVPSSRAEPPAEIERIAIVDPRQAVTVQLGESAKGSGPRDPGQLKPLSDDDAEPRIELPDGLPMTAPQAVYVPPELAAKWREEANRAGTS